MAFGYGGGQYEAVTTSCEGKVLDAERHSYRTGGALVDAWPADRVRVSGSLGIVRGGPYTGNALDRRLLVAYEGNRFGIGTGIVRVAIPELDDFPYTFYGRLGLLDDVHLRADLFHPSVVPAMPGGLRVGLASGLSRCRGANGDLGFSLDRKIGRRRLLDQLLSTLDLGAADTRLTDWELVVSAPRPG